MQSILPALAIFNMGWTEVVLLGLLGLLIFGKRLPEVGRSLGKGIVEFKKGLSGVEDDVNKSMRSSTPPQVAHQAPPAPLNLQQPTEASEQARRQA